MNIEEIICSHNYEYYNIYSLVIKKYLLNLIINKKSINTNINTNKYDEYDECINYFININDINFKDSLEDIDIANILFNSLNIIQFHKNNIIILDTFYLFNHSNQPETINYSLENINLNFKLEFNFNLFDDISYIISKIDNIYYNLSGFNNCIFNKMYKKYLFQNKKSRIEINKRIKEISLLITKIYKLVLNENININDINRDIFINSIRIISILKFKYLQLESKERDELNIETIKELLLIFKKEETESEIEIDYDLQKKNILNIIILHDKLCNEFCKRKTNETNEDIIDFIERIFNEYDSLNEILKELINKNFIDELFSNFITDMNSFIELNEKIEEDKINILKEFIKLTTEIINKCGFDEYENISYYENIFKIQLLNYKMKQTIQKQNNILKLNDDLNKISESKNMIEIQKILEEINKEIEKNDNLINIYNLEIDKIKNLSYSHGTEDEKINEQLDEEIFNINKNIDELLYFYNEKGLQVNHKEVIELFNNCGIKYNYVNFNGIIDIFNNKEIFLKFIDNLEIVKKDISKKNIELFLILFNYKKSEKSETYETYVNRIKQEGLTFYNNKFKLNNYEIDFLISRIGFFIKDLIEI
jgi:hypothetical protein